MMLESQGILKMRITKITEYVRRSRRLYAIWKKKNLEIDTAPSSSSV